MAQDASEPRHGDDGDHPPPLAHEPPPPAGSTSPDPDSNEDEGGPSAWREPEDAAPDRTSYRPRHRARRREPTPHAAPPAAETGEEAEPEERTVRRPPYGGRWDKLVASQEESSGTAGARAPGEETRPEIADESSTVPEGEPGPNERSGLWRRPSREQPVEPSPGERKGDEAPVTGTLVRRPPKAGPASEPGRQRTPAGLLVVLLLLLMGGAVAFSVYIWLSPAEPGVAAPRLETGEALIGDKFFTATSDAKGHGIYQRLEDVAASGSTMVAVGSDFTSTPPRPLFVVSTDGGKTWSLGEVSGGGGGAVTPVRHVAGDGAGWLAAGGERGSTHRMWTSKDGRKWAAVTAKELAPFGRADRIAELARTNAGFVAVGDTLKGGRRYPVTWTSKDGTGWKRRAAGNMPAALSTVAADGGAVVAMGKTAAGKPMALRSVDGGATWRMVDDGRLAKAGIPDGVAAAGAKGFEPGGGRGFVAAVRTRKPALESYCSKDGEKWSKCGQIGSIDNHGRLADISGFGDGLSAAVQTSWETYSVYTSGDGRTWKARKIGRVRNAGLRGVAAGKGGAVAVVGDGQAEGVDNQPFLWTSRKGRIGAEKVKGLIKEQRRTGSLLAAEDQLVTVGSARGDAAIWTTRDGGKWVHGQQRGEAFGGPGRQELHDIAHGPRGWLAAGVGQDVTGTRPLVVTSTDGETWQKVPALERAALAAGEDRLEMSVATGPAGSVITGEGQGPGPVVWHSADNNRFAAARLPRAPGGGVRLRDVSATQDGFIAVGGSGAGVDETGVVWTSEDGKTWTAVAAPEAPQGGSGAGLRQVVAYENRLVAVGTSRRDGAWVPFAAVSEDGGETWETGWLATRQASEVRDVLATERGLIAVGTTGPFETSDSVVWLSGDGLSWETQLVRGEGLSGQGAQWLQGVSKLGDQVIAVGRSVTITEDRLTIWRTSIK